MNISPPLTHKAKAGTCPHGLPLGACPICNGMGGGGGGSGSSKKTTKPEMSWSECYVMWQQMQKAKQNPQHQNEAIQAQMISQFKLQVSLDNMAQSVTNLTKKLTAFIQKSRDSSQSTPTIASKLLNLSASLAVAGLNVLKNAMTAAQKVINFVQEKLADISDKLNAVFGELKNAIEKKISDRLKDFKKKIKSLFEIFNVKELEEEAGKKDEERDFLINSSTIQPFDHSTNKKELEYGISS